MTHYSVASTLPVTWRKATASNPNENCVEFGQLDTTAVVVRDSKDAHGPALAFDATAWQAFVAGIRSGDFPTDN
ncbi:DUF397 domain-containing protein [Streptomyces sp. CB01881]|uniref:DUF397 domain-containing protein n=1 Tax=Streptomyces sp. CB01881 TaxID=2078691 RepID=UPI000CDCDF6B|nr:DUF397 domain-containing protein [Streptomyces sp. CB01881]AUY47856.1 DUF397 domain-containing protein [Streptomyces sp. CB01881]TYC76331.1 DUF397 domain-containing protein [Streptomyces sp. CB01881]